MRTRISKHGKYEIMEGVEREVGDMLQPGDLLTANSVVGPPAQVEVITRLKDREQYDEFKDKLTPLDRLAFALFDVSGHEQMFFDENAYVIKTSGDKYTLWTPGGDAERDEAPVKIKRRIKQDTGIVADTVIAGDIHADRINGAKKVEEAEPQVPTEPGLYKDKDGDVAVFFRTLDEEDGDDLANQKNQNVAVRRKYTITGIKRPVENMLPDAPGPWLDKNLDTWVVNDDLNAIRVSYDGEWLLSGGIILPSEYAEYAPFKKINIIKEKA